MASTMVVQNKEETWKSLKEEPEQEEVGEMVDQNENSIKCVNKAMELPLVSGLTDTLAATTNYIATTKSVTMVTEKIKNVGEREDVKNMLSSVNNLYQDNLSQSVEGLKESLNPTLRTLDNMACSGIDKVNDKISDTKEQYVTPVVSRVVETRETYVDPVLEKAANIKETTVKKVGECREQVTSINDNYLTPAMNQASSIKENYVAPALEQAKQAVEDPTKAYVRAVDYGTQLVIATKDVGLSKAAEVVESAKTYLATARDNATAQLYSYAVGVKERAASLALSSLDQTITYAKLNRAYAVQKAVAVAEAGRSRLANRFPALLEYLDTGAATIKTVAQGVASTASNVYTSSRNVASQVSHGMDRVRETALQAVKTNEPRLRSVANHVGLSSYLGYIGLDEKEKAL